MQFCCKVSYPDESNEFAAIGKDFHHLAELVNRLEEWSQACQILATPLPEHSSLKLADFSEQVLKLHQLEGLLLSVVQTILEMLKGRGECRITGSRHDGRLGLRGLCTGYRNLNHLRMK